MRVFVTGATGLIGKRLVRRLIEQKHDVVFLSRKPAGESIIGHPAFFVQGDPTLPGPWQDRAAECEVIINLAGEGVFNESWTPQFKARLHDSRVRSTEQCVAAIMRQPTRTDGTPKVLVNASAIGYYGPHGPEPLDESSPPGSDFLASICVDWELATAPAAQAGARVVPVRIGIVLAREGGPLTKMLTPFKLGVGGPIGSGRQYMSWVHIEDIVGLLVFALENPNARGPMNGTAPEPVTNKQFGKTLGKVLGRPAFMWTPGFMLKLVLGGAAELVTTGQNVVPKKALELGYHFKYSKLDLALANILG
jgi:uncharacterized protein (TIGR01777 family)